MRKTDFLKRMVSESRCTKDHQTIQTWIIARGGVPALLRLDNRREAWTLLRVKFSPFDDDLEEISWEKFFEIFDARDLTFLYEVSMESQFNRFIYDDD